MNAQAPGSWEQLCSNALPVEQSVIGSCLVYPDAIDIALELVVADDFAEPAHKLLFAAMANARKDGRRLDAGLIRSTLAERMGDDLGGLTLGEYIARLVREAPGAFSVREHVKALRDVSDLRRLFLAGEELKQKATRGLACGLPRDMAIDAIQELDRVISSNAPSHLRPTTIGQAAANVLENIRLVHAGEKAKRRPQYGIPELDDMTGGMHGGHLTIVAARPSMGKSAFAVSAALSATKSGHHVGFFSLEMSTEEIGARCLSSLSYDPRRPIPYMDMQLGRVDPADDMGLGDAQRRMDSMPIRIDASPGLTPMQIGMRARNLSQALGRDGRRLDLIVVDHLGKIRPSDRYAGNRTTELGEITGAMKDLARELDCSVMVLCQLNRQTEQRENKRPTLGDLRESGRIEEDADNVLLLYRPSYYEERTKHDGESTLDRMARIAEVERDMEIIVAKQRQGRTGLAEAWCDMRCNVIQGRGR